MLTQKTVGYESEATTHIDCSQLRDGDHAGLLCMGNRFMGVGVCRQDGRLSFYLEQDGECIVLSPCKQKTAYLRVQIDSRKNCHQFLISTDGKKFTEAGESFSLRMGNWKGSRIGLYAYHKGYEEAGIVHFADFNYQINR